MRWRTAGTISPTATTSYGAHEVSAQIEEEDASVTLPSDDMAYEARAPRLRLPAKPLAEIDPSLPDPSRAAGLAAWRQREGEASAKVKGRPDSLGGWVWTLIGIAVFALCFLVGFFVAPAIPVLHLP
jgi:hypothetical protein